MKQRLLIAFLSAFLALILGGSAYAFECYNAQRSDQGNRSAAKSQALMSFEEILSDPEIVGLCPAGVEHVISGLEDEDFRTDVLINFRTLMAQGLEKAGHDAQLDDGKGVDHLTDEFFEAGDVLIGEGFDICAGGA